MKIHRGTHEYQIFQTFRASNALRITILKLLDISEFLTTHLPVKLGSIKMSQQITLYMLGNMSEDDSKKLNAYPDLSNELKIEIQTGKESP